MSEYFQSVVFPDVSAADARSLGGEILAFLIASGVVLREPGREPHVAAGGHPPGPRAHEHTEPDFDHTRGLKNDVVEVVTGREVFHAGGNAIEACDGCGVRFDPGRDFGDRVQEWVDGDDDASWRCPSCGRSERLPDWDGPWAWGFCHLGVTFWNWPPLLPEFVRSLEEVAGHKARVVHGKL